MILTNSISDQNVYLTYTCLVNDINPSNHERKNESNKLSNICKLEDDDIVDNDEPIKVEKSRAIHQLIESDKNAGLKDSDGKDNNDKDLSTPYTIRDYGHGNEKDESTFVSFGNPNILKLTKMKWLTEDKDEAPDSSFSSLSPASSISSIFSRGSDDNLNECLNDRHLSTILRIDKEHNMFGLSNIAIVRAKSSRKIRKEDERAVFYQTAIVQICCGKRCCKHRSNTDLPSSLKCGGCRGCCVDPCCPICIGSCGPPCDKSPCPSLCVSCPSGNCNCRSPCPPSKCMMDCSTCFGLKISLNKKPKYEPSPIELTPRSSCVLQKPLIARSCHHLPRCVPPSSCFPYLMPCFWPARAGAPCNDPARCFHNPPCPPPRKRKSIIPPEEMCPKTGKCENDSKKTKCSNISCLGRNDLFKREIENRFDKKQKI